MRRWSAQAAASTVGPPRLAWPVSMAPGSRSSRARILMLNILVASSACCSAAQLPGAAVAAAKTQPPVPHHPTYLLPPRGVPADAIRLHDGDLVSATTGQPVRLRAAAWTAHTAGGTFDEFLAATPGDTPQHARLTAALVAGTSALLEQGFNSVQLPLALGAVLAVRPAAAAAPQCRQVPVSEFRLNATTSNGSSSSTPGQQPQRPQCASLLPNTTALDRVLWSIQWFAAHGLFVTVSASSANSSTSATTGRPAGCSSAATGNDSCAAGDGPHAAAAGSDAARSFAAAWSAVWRAVVGLPNFEADLRGRVFLQLLQDPAAAGARWEPAAASSAGGSSGLGALYLAAMDAVEAVRPGAALFILPGAAQRSARTGGGGQAESSSSSVWGHGYATEPAMMAAGMSDPRPFLTALVGKPYSGRVVLAPYAMGQPDAAASSARGAAPPPAAAAALPVDAAKVLDNSFSKLSAVGFCTGAPAHPREQHMLHHAGGDASAGTAAEGTCTRFPVCQPAGRAQLLDQQPGIEEELAAFAAQLAEDALLQQTGADAMHAAGSSDPPGDWVFWDFAAPAAAPGQAAAGAAGQAEEGAPRRMQAESEAAVGDAASVLAASRMREADKVFARESGAGSTRLVISDIAAASEGGGGA